MRQRPFSLNPHGLRPGARVAGGDEDGCGPFRIPSIPCIPVEKSPSLRSGNRQSRIATFGLQAGRMGRREPLSVELSMITVVRSAQFRSGGMDRLGQDGLLGLAFQGFLRQRAHPFFERHVKKPM